MIEENMKFYKGNINNIFTISRIESIKRNDVLYTHTYIYKGCFFVENTARADFAHWNEFGSFLP